MALCGLSPAELLRQQRMLLGISQYEVAALAKAQQPAISRIERGVHVPSLDTLAALLEPLGMDIAIATSRNLPALAQAQLEAEQAGHPVSVRFQAPVSDGWVIQGVDDARSRARVSRLTQQRRRHAGPNR